MDATRTDLGLLDFRPFRAWRYQTSHVALNGVIAPPYDVISPAERDALYEKSPFNVVRLILGREVPFYEHAAQCWKEWTQKGILAQDDHRALYLYEQVFHHPVDSRKMSRMAMVGILKLDEPGAVLRHESTFEGPKKDRFLLLEKTKTSLSPIFGLYQDAGKLSGLFSSYRKSRPLFEAGDGEGVLHRGWAVGKEDDQKIIHDFLATQKVLIADGHHRYETALEYRRQMRQKFPEARAEAPFDFVMMALVSSEDPGLLVLPTHRIIRSLAPSSPEQLEKNLREYFDCTPGSADQMVSSLQTLSQDRKVFGLTLKGNRNYLIQLKEPNTVRSKLPPAKPAIWYEIEANLLTHLVFDRIWGLAQEKRQGVIEYTHSSEEAVRAVQEGRGEAAFLMRAPEVDTIRQLAYAGERMPQKTTYFYPKLGSGLFFYHHG